MIRSRFSLPVCLAAATVLVSPTWAAGKRSATSIAHQLGNVLASEQPCNLSYDQAAIERYVHDNVDPSEMQFASMLSLMTDGASVSIAKLSGSGKTAHCAAIRQSAKRYGFIE